jgi:hypothetical protein
MKKATATCYVCEKAFRYYKITKPRRFCSGACEYHRERQLQNDRRRALAAAKRRAAAASCAGEGH